MCISMKEMETQTGKQNKEAQLGSMPVGKLLLELAIPAITAQIINLLYNVVDRIYIGHIPGEGAMALTGMGVTLPVIMLVTAFSSLIGFGGAPRASICMGKQENDKAEEILGNCVTTLLLISVLLTVLLQLFGERILMVFGASDQTIPYAMDYMSIYTLGTVFVQISLGLNMFITSQGFTRVSMKTVLIGAVLNIILDPLFIFVFGMGVKGAALATILSQCVSSIWVLSFLCGKNTILRVKKQYLMPRARVIFPVLALGVSPFIMSATESVLTVCFNTSLLKYGGDVAVGAMTILASVMQFSMLPLQGMTQGMQPIISFNYGAGHADRVKKTFKLTLIVCLCYSITLWAVAMLFPNYLAMAFTTDQELIAYASWAMRIYMGVAGIFGAQIACQQTFLALGNASVSLFLAVLRKIILLIPLIYILPNFFEDKVFAVFLAEPVADFLAVATTVILFTMTFRKMMGRMETRDQEQSGERREETV